MKLLSYTVKPIITYKNEQTIGHAETHWYGKVTINGKTYGSNYDVTLPKRMYIFGPNYRFDWDEKISDIFNSEKNPVVMLQFNMGDVPFTISSLEEYFMEKIAHVGSKANLH